MYQYIKKYPNDFTPDVIENYLLDKGLMTDYIDEFKADGLLPADYQYKGAGTSTTTTPPPAEVQKSAHTHSYKEEVTKESTCLAEGTLTKTCECGHVVKEKIPLGEHEYFEQVIKEADCLVDGEIAYLCSVCDNTYSEPIPATGHQTGDEEIMKEASCTTDGEKGVKCSACGEYIEKETVPATGHQTGDWEVTKEPGLISNGEQVKKCSVCGEILETEVLPYNQSFLTGIIAGAVALCGIIGFAVYKVTHKTKRL